jgi:hypothetical protein
MNKEIVIWGYNSTREGDKWVKSIYYILFIHIGISWESGFVRFLGKPHGALLHAII